MGSITPKVWEPLLYGFNTGPYNSDLTPLAQCASFATAYQPVTKKGDQSSDVPSCNCRFTRPAKQQAVWLRLIYIFFESGRVQSWLGQVEPESTSSDSKMIWSIENWKMLHFLHNSPALQTRVVESETAFHVPTPQSSSFWLRLSSS